MGAKVLSGELGSRGRSIQAGSLCYNNGCAVEVVTRLDAASAPPAQRVTIQPLRIVALPSLFMR
jgi:hypothetical protein